MVESVSAVALLFVDMWSRITQVSGLPVWRWLRPWQPYLPAVYGSLFIIALFMLRAEYESADYDFCVDPDTEHIKELDEDAMGGAHTYRVCVANFGHAPINVQVRLKNIMPLPHELQGKLGMPLVPMGEEHNTSSVKITPGARQAFNVLSHLVRFTGQSTPDGTDCHEEFLILWHDWSGAPKEIKVGEYAFELLLTPDEGRPKAEWYRFRPDLLIAEKRLERIKKPSV